MSLAFQTAEHEAFDFAPCGVARGCAVLVHGFPGSPAEMRGLGRVLAESGLRARGVLLPGFGAEIETLASRDHREWVAAVAASLDAAARRGGPVVAVGYSMGAALVLAAVAQGAPPPERMVLLAPFSKLGVWWQRWLWPAFKAFNPQLRPFAKADPSDPALRGSLERILGDADLDDPEVLAGLRALTIPASLIEQIDAAGRAGWRAAPRVARPALVIAGRDDVLVPPARAQRLARRLAGPVQVQQLPVEHDMTWPERSGAHWPVLARSVAGFAATGDARVIDARTEEAVREVMRSAAGSYV
jgi:carboxylesterase